MANVRCEECGYECGTSRGLRRHMTVTHGMEPAKPKPTGVPSVSKLIAQERKVAEAVALVFPKGISTTDVNQLMQDLQLVHDIRARVTGGST